MDREQIRAIVREVIEAMFESSIPVGVSNRLSIYVRRTGMYYSRIRLLLRKVT